MEPDLVHYPDSDGQPMADNTLQFSWIAKIKENLNFALSHFVAGDLLWYPVRGSNKIRRAPDVLVAFGRPKGYRGSYKQWEEDDVAPQVVFEVLSPRNTAAEMLDKLAFYQEYGVREFYIIDPEEPSLRAFIAEGDTLRAVPFDSTLTSPLLGIRFELGEDLVLRHADGTIFQEAEEVLAERSEALERAHEAEERAQEATDRARQATARAQEAEERARSEAQRAEILAAKLRELGIQLDDEG